MLKEFRYPLEGLQKFNQLFKTQQFILIIKGLLFYWQDTAQKACSTQGGSVELSNENFCRPTV